MIAQHEWPAAASAAAAHSAIALSPSPVSPTSRPSTTPSYCAVPRLLPWWAGAVHAHTRSGLDSTYAAHAGGAAHAAHAAHATHAAYAAHTSRAGRARRSWWRARWPRRRGAALGRASRAAAGEPSP